MTKKACHSELVSETNKGGESLPLARTSSLATLSSGGHPRNAPVDSPIEAPYELPKGWKWCRLGDCSSVISKGTTPKGGKDAYLKEGVNFLRIENLNEDGSINLSNISHISIEEHEGNLKRSILEEGDLLISIAGTLGKVGFVTKADLPMNTNQAIAFIRLYKDIFDNMYLKYAIESPFVNAELLAKTKVTSIPNLTLEIISNCLIPLPPTLTEQKRIVNRIETMFAKLDQAQEKAQSVLDSFETRKAAILHKAFTGELTANWRKENGVADESWEKKTIGEAMHLQAGKNISANKISEENNNTNQYPCFGGNGIRGYVDTFNNEGSFPIIGRQGALCGNLNFATGKFYATEHAVVVTCPSTINPIWAYYTLKTMNLNQYATATAQPGLAVSNIVKLNIFIPALPEQHEIVRILDTVLEKESRAKEAAQTVLDQIALLKKSILARAFRGEL